MKCIKKQIIITATAVFIGTASFTQTNVTLTTQAQVDAWGDATVTGNLAIFGGTSITSLAGLSELTTVEGNLRISNSNRLISLSGLDNLTSIADMGLNISHNSSLLSLQGLGKLTSSPGIAISNNAKLTNLNALSALTSVITIIFNIDGNLKLTSLQGLEGITTSMVNLSISSNSKLSTLNGLNSLTTLGGRLLIGTVDGSIDGPNPALINFCAISQLVTGDMPQIIKTEGADNEYFVANNAYNPTHAQLGVAATCVNTTLTTDLTLITQTQIDNLTPYTKIDGNVTINDTSAGTITSLSGLTNITSITGNLAILSNMALTSLQGLGNLATLDGQLQIGTIDKTPGSSMPNAALTDFCAISSLVTGASAIDATTEYFVENNAYNPNYAQLGNMATCVNTIRSGSLTLSTQIDIDNFTSTPFTGIAINLTIKEATAGTITSLSGLTNITSITGNLAILSNMALTSLEGLGNLATLGGQLQIGTITGEDDSSMPNMALTDFCAISQLVTGTPPQVIIGEYFVENNAYNPSYVGLASADAATTASEMDGCRKFGTAVVSTNTFSKEDGYRLFPNPVTDVLFVKSESEITSITISNVSGQEVLKSNSGSINVRDLSKGIYFARIVSGEKTVVEKFVKL